MSEPDLSFLSPPLSALKPLELPSCIFLIFLYILSQQASGVDPLICNNKKKIIFSCYSFSKFYTM
jgi:hypothetical protein